MKPPAGEHEITGWMGGAGETTRQQVVSKPLVNQCLLQPLVSRWFQNHSSTNALVLWWCCGGAVLVRWWCCGGAVVVLWWCCLGAVKEMLEGCVKCKKYMLEGCVQCKK